MKIIVNQETIEFKGNTISDLQEKHRRTKIEGFVVVVNKSLVLKSQWNLFKLNEADSVFIIIPAEGG